MKCLLTLFVVAYQLVLSRTDFILDLYWIFILNIQLIADKGKSIFLLKKKIFFFRICSSELVFFFLSLQSLMLEWVVVPSFLLFFFLSCSLFWLRHFKAPRGSLGIIFFSSRNVSVPPHMHHMGCSQQPLHIRAQRRRRQPMVCPSLCTGSAPPARGDTGRAPSSHQAAPER